MSSELVPRDGVTTHWALGTFGVTACGLVSSTNSVPMADKVRDLSCKNCLRYVSKTYGNIYACEICDRYWMDYDEVELHMYSHD